MQSTLNDPDIEAAWTRVAPMLDIAMAQLGEKDHNAIVLRFFEGKDLKQVGAALGVCENTAKSRVSRAVERLRQFFVRRGVTLSAVVIAGAISANSVQAAPVTLAKTATVVAVAKGATASGSTLALVKGALKIMAWTKAQTVIVISVAAILAAGTVTTLEVHRQRARIQTEYPRSSWMATGYADPVSAFETGLWAAVQGDGKTLLTSCSPRMQGDTTVKVGRQMQVQGKSLDPEEIFAQTGASYIEGVTGFRILDKTTSGNQVILHLQLEGKEQKQTITMKKIGGEWKIDDIQ